MDFQRQCRRFNNYRVFNEQQFKTPLTNISAISSFKISNKPQSTVVSTQNLSYRLVIADNTARVIQILNEADGHVLRTLKHNNWEVYGISCTNRVANNFIYVTDYANNCIHKLDENLVELKRLTTPEDIDLKGPCGISVNNELERVDVVDQKNHRIVSFSLKTDEFISDLPLYREFFEKLHKIQKPLIEIILNNPEHKRQQSNYYYHSKKLINCWPFGLASKNERIYVVDWSESHIYVYKNNELELKIGGPQLFTRIRDVVIDNLDNILVTDIYRKSVFIFDNKGNFLMETKLPTLSEDAQDTIYGVCKIDNTRLALATNSSILVFNLGPL